jgi:hypothetical protein
VEVLVDDIRLLEKGLNSASFIYVKPELNEAADLLARFCNSINYSEVFYSAPNCIWRILCIDVILSVKRSFYSLDVHAFVLRIVKS